MVVDRPQRLLGGEPLAPDFWVAPGTEPRLSAHAALAGNAITETQAISEWDLDTFQLGTHTPGATRSCLFRHV